MSNGINVDYINPFIEATAHTFQTMCSVAATRQRIFIKKSSDENYGISGVIGLDGEASGAVVLNFPEAMALKVVSRVLGEQLTTFSAEVVDGVGELTNIIAGDAKNRLIQKGYKFDIGLPRIVTGRTYIAAQNRTIPCVVICFGSELGEFRLEVSLAK